MRKEKETVAKQLIIVQDYRSTGVQEYRYRYIYSRKQVKAENFFKIRLSWAIFSLKCGAVVLI